MAENSDKIIRKTKSICLKCLKKVEASVVARDGKVLLVKHCPEHNDSQVLLSNSEFYINLERFYFPMVKKKNVKPVERPELIITSSCNMECPVCYLGDLRRQTIGCDPTLEQIERFVSGSSLKMFVLTGGEPTCRGDLIDIIAMLKRHKKTVVLNTNGIKLKDYDYLRMLKRAGLDRVNFQFSGFEKTAEKDLRGNDYLPEKLKALENLEKIDMPTGLNVLISGRCNEGQIARLFEFSRAHGNIKLLNLSTMIFVGYTKDLSSGAYLAPDDIFSLIEEQTHGKIRKRNIYLFKKLEIVVSSFFNRGSCFYNYSYLIIREKGGYKPIDDYVRLDKIEPHLDRYQKIFLRNTWLARIYLIIAFFVIYFFDVKFWALPREIYLRLLSHFFDRASFLKPKKLLYLLFSANCDLYRIDYEINDVCPCKAIFFFKKEKGNIVKSDKANVSTYWKLVTEGCDGK